LAGLAATYSSKP